jgi:hypothetical protein
MLLEQTNAVYTGPTLPALVAVPIEELGRGIVARVSLGDRAKDRAEHMYRSAGLQLIEARSRVNDFSAFLRDHCPDLSRSRAYELIAIAEGKGDEVRSKARGRDRRRREKAAGVRGSRTRGVSVRKPEPAEPEAQKALAEFKVAVDIWFAKMDEANRRDAVAYAISRGRESLS